MFVVMCAVVLHNNNAVVMDFFLLHLILSLDQHMPVRAHYFWPVICQFGEIKDCDGE